MRQGTATDIVKDSVVATYVLEVSPPAKGLSTPRALSTPCSLDLTAPLSSQLDGTFFNFGGTVKAAYEEFGGMALAPGRDGLRPEPLLHSYGSPIHASFACT